MADLVDVRADAVFPGEVVCLGGAAILITWVDRVGEVVDLHTEFGPALRLLGRDVVPILVSEDAAGAA